MRGMCFWLTGLPSSGKTSIGKKFSEFLNDIDVKHDLLDGDELRKNVSRSLGFTKEDRIENIKNVAYLAASIVKYGGTVVASIIAPYQEMRDNVRKAVEAAGGKFFEIYVNTPLEVCIQRDVKGLYKKAIAGEIANFTGISDPYEVPIKPDLILDCHTRHIDCSLADLVAFAVGESTGFNFNNEARALFIGRWQPFHNGHDYIIREKLKKGLPVLIAVRDTPINDSNPYTLKERIEMIREVYKGEDVQVMAIPDIESVNIGRNVGYAVHEYEVPTNIAAISATEIRQLRNKNDDSWKSKVPLGVSSYLEALGNK